MHEKRFNGYGNHQVKYLFNCYITRFNVKEEKNGVKAKSIVNNFDNIKFTFILMFKYFK